MRIASLNPSSHSAFLSFTVSSRFSYYTRYKSPHAQKMGDRSSDMSNAPPGISEKHPSPFPVSSADSQAGIPCADTVSYSGSPSPSRHRRGNPDIHHNTGIHSLRFRQRMMPQRFAQNSSLFASGPLQPGQGLSLISAREQILQSNPQGATISALNFMFLTPRLFTPGIHPSRENTICISGLFCLI